MTADGWRTARPGLTPPRNVTIERTTWTGTSATVEASFDFDGPPSTITPPLVIENRLGSTDTCETGT